MRERKLSKVPVSTSSFLRYSIMLHINRKRYAKFSPQSVRGVIFYRGEAVTSRETPCLPTVILHVLRRQVPTRDRDKNPLCNTVPSLRGREHSKIRHFLCIIVPSPPGREHSKRSQGLYSIVASSRGREHSKMRHFLRNTVPSGSPRGRDHSKQSQARSIVPCLWGEWNRFNFGSIGSISLHPLFLPHGRILFYNSWKVTFGKLHMDCSEFHEWLIHLHCDHWQWVVSTVPTG